MSSSSNVSDSPCVVVVQQLVLPVSTTTLSDTSGSLPLLIGLVCVLLVSFALVPYLQTLPYLSHTPCTWSVFFHFLFFFFLNKLSGNCNFQTIINRIWAYNIMFAKFFQIIVCILFLLRCSSRLDWFGIKLLLNFCFCFLYIWDLVSTIDSLSFTGNMIVWKNVLVDFILYSLCFGNTEEDQSHPFSELFLYYLTYANSKWIQSCAQPWDAVVSWQKFPNIFM